MTRSKDGAVQSKQGARSERRREQTRAEILSAAQAVVLRDGFSKFSLAKVAAELGLTKPALYYYFAAKEALLFEMFLSEWAESATEIQAAVEQTETGADAVETLMRGVFNRYRGRLDIFAMTYTSTPMHEVENLIGPEQLARLHPLNDVLYGGAERRLRTCQQEGRFPQDRDPRRFVFTAHMAIVGVLNMKAMVSPANDPLIHGDDALIDDLCTTFLNNCKGDSQ